MAGDILYKLKIFTKFYNLHNLLQTFLQLSYFHKPSYPFRNESLEQLTFFLFPQKYFHLMPSGTRTTQLLSNFI